MPDVSDHRGGTAPSAPIARSGEGTGTHTGSKSVSGRSPHTWEAEAADRAAWHGATGADAEAGGKGAREGGTPWSKTSPKKQKESPRGALHHRQGPEYKFNKTGAQIETIKWC